MSDGAHLRNTFNSSGRRGSALAHFLKLPNDLGVPLAPAIAAESLFDRDVEQDLIEECRNGGRIHN